MTPNSNSKAALKFLALVFIVSTPFWMVGFFWKEMLLPGLPLSAFMVVCPAMVAGILILRDGGRSELYRFFAQAWDVRKMRPWAWFATLGIMPLVMSFSGGLLILSGTTLPSMEYQAGQTLILFVMFFIAATAEELGWTGYATRRLLRSWSVFGTGILIGLAAAVWHVVPLLQAQRAWDWIAWWTLGSVARRILIVWVYAQGGQSVFSASLFHAMSNLTWMLFPVMGSHYDPRTTGIVLLAFVLILFVFQPSLITRSISEGRNKSTKKKHL